MTESVDAQRISEIPGFPMTRTCPFAPPPEYAELRESTPTSKVQLTLNGRKAWLLTRYDDVVQVLSDPRASSDITLDGYPLFMPVPIEILKASPRTLFHMDPPQHTVQRRLLIPEFTVRRIQASRERTQEITDELIDRMLAAGGPVDLVDKLALPLPSYAMCELIGIPRSDRDFLHHWIGQLVGKDTTPEQHGALQMQMGAYMDKLLGDKEQDPGDDLVSRLIIRNVEQEAGLTKPELAVLLQAVIAGGHETTANMIALGVLALLRNPDQLDKLKADPSLAPKAVEELLRLFSVSDFGTSRVALEDMEVGDVTIRAGEGIIASMAAANHDPAVFADPGRLDIERTPNKHVALGHGLHQCSGQGLVRMQLEVVFNTLFRRIPDLSLAVDFDDLRYKDYSLIHGLAELPVTW